MQSFYYYSVFILTTITVVISVEDTKGSFNYKCLREGRFKDVTDCGSYIECISDDQGFIKAYKKSCHGRAFDPSSRICVNPSKIPDCKIRQARYVQSHNKYKDVCKDGNIPYICGDCQTVVKCIENQAYPETCEKDFRCVEDLEAFNGDAVCHKKFEESCSCQEPNSYRKDPYNNATFFFCKDKDAVPNYYNCPEETHFNEEDKTCYNNDGSPTCTKAGMFVYPEDCSRYYVCTSVVEGWAQAGFNCKDQQLFNEQTKKCEDPCQWQNNDKFQCPSEGRFKDNNNCHKFNECIQDLDGKLILTERRCPPTYHWNDESKTCISQSSSNCEQPDRRPYLKCKKDVALICENSPPTETSTDQPTTTTESTTVQQNIDEHLNSILRRKIKREKWNV